MLGLHKHGEFRSEKENVDEDILVMGRAQIPTKVLSTVTLFSGCTRALTLENFYQGLAVVEVDIMAPIDVAKSPKVCSIP